MKNLYGIFIIIFLIFITNLFAQEQDSLLLIGGTSTDGLYGYINREGEIVIKPKYDWACDFHEGVAVVRIGNEKHGFIDQTGKLLYECDSCYTQLEFSEGLISVKYNDSPYYFIIDKFGKKAFDMGFMNAFDFQEGLAAVEFSKFGNTGFINKNGDLVIDTIYSFTSSFTNGYASAYRPDLKLWGILDTKGNFTNILKGLYIAGEYHNGLFPVTDTSYKKWGYMNAKGEIVIGLKFRSAQGFSEGLAAVYFEDKGWGYIDTTGKVVIEPKFTAADMFSEGLASVYYSSKLIVLGLTEAFINRSGEVVIKGVFYDSQPFKHGICQYWTGDDFSGDIEYIRNDGKKIWPKLHKH